jgi:hypothetical protein
MAERTKEPEGDTGAPQQPARNVTEVSKDTVERLGAKLDGFARDLSDDERLTLATALALAGRGFGTFMGVTCAGDLRIGVGTGALSIERLSSGAEPKLSDTLADAFCVTGSSSRFSIEGLEVEKTMVGTKSVGAAGAKSVAAACANPAFAGNFACRGAKSVAAGNFPGNFACRGAKSVAAANFGNIACRGAKSVAAGNFPGNFACRGAKSVAAGNFGNIACRGAKSVAAGNFGNIACRGAKSVAAGNFACRGAKSVAAWNQGLWR